MHILAVLPGQFSFSSCGAACSYRTGLRGCGRNLVLLCQQ